MPGTARTWQWRPYFAEIGCRNGLKRIHEATANHGQSRALLWCRGDGQRGWVLRVHDRPARRLPVQRARPDGGRLRPRMAHAANAIARGERRHALGPRARNVARRNAVHRRGRRRRRWLRHRGSAARHRCRWGLLVAGERRSDPPIDACADSRAGCAGEGQPRERAAKERCRRGNSHHSGYFIGCGRGGGNRAPRGGQSHGHKCGQSVQRLLPPTLRLSALEAGTNRGVTLKTPSMR